MANLSLPLGFVCKVSHFSYEGSCSFTLLLLLISATPVVRCLVRPLGWDFLTRICHEDFEGGVLSAWDTIDLDSASSSLLIENLPSRGYSGTALHRRARTGAVGDAVVSSTTSQPQQRENKLPPSTLLLSLFSLLSSLSSLPLFLWINSMSLCYSSLNFLLFKSYVLYPYLFPCAE